MIDKLDKIINLIKLCNSNTKCVVRVQDLSDSFEVGKGLRKGDALLPVLFNLALESLIRRMSQQQGMEVNKYYIICQCGYNNHEQYKAKYYE